VLIQRGGWNPARSMATLSAVAGRKEAAEPLPKEPRSKGFASQISVRALDSQNVGLQLAVAAFACPEVQRQRGQIIDDWNRQA
jgi:hypothetical protein